MILVDTSAWVDFFSGQETPPVLKLEFLIEQQRELCICGVIMTEILQGIRNDSEYKKTLSLLSKLLYLPMNPGCFIQASQIYRHSRKKGITIRNSVDCMIASICLTHGCQLLHNDRGFTFIAELFPLQIIETTP